MRDLNWHIRQLCRRNKDGSIRTQEGRYHTLIQIANELHTLGYRRIKGPQNLKPKHVYALLNQWQHPLKPLAVGTIKNRLACLRWMAQKCSNSSLIHGSNDHYGIARRSFVGMDKALVFSDERINQVTDLHVRYAARLQQHFGLRREEAIKFQVAYADQGTHLSLKPSWCKGGRGRQIPITTDAQRSLLQSIRQQVGHASLIPSHLKYIQQLRIFEKQMHRVGLGRTHGARHHYAQQRYEVLTRELMQQLNAEVTQGLKCVARGGKPPFELDHRWRLVDREARAILSRELGHERIQICAVYLGG